ncbi:alpha/beta hydrolase, putative [Plasmodium knowlesi strain H]|uniref:Alpha/beta hydrolase, putative n=3 Tax=Plasmodium knowlesi TaxID=5850 RepID=A0A5K1UTD4_PLAKH|nr:uncharacterized protein PKNH_1317400 [Plasmodium knowlesi strain H]OTN68023.1 putative Alpha/beta hydrolase [Plasmodium knowlesi]CAA9990212.1 alpha/beta hydrolase, putative [Plasmodium knowlesi strain H]SBO26851.1 alpha/beta hydrolase, putative [Plasmodium knowlesi strain H]SBO28464.1 alpha/beta hydrolase, putative [Plasmodium knowlesi strain H]VVS79686.1 alpha/beta hydrolase, putative [Plasmodium knowlesi strain H]|eukprot:XP_002258089.1 [Plasmodium knowlesi strain H]
MFHLYELLMFFLRNPRDKYEEEFLGPIFLHFSGKNYYRRDMIINNRRGEKLKCCFFTPFNYNENTPCVIYTHSSCSCQLEALDILHILLICECSIFSYDCSGCGLSDGYFSTSGWNESQDLFLILHHLRNVEHVKNFALWGKYSGAVSSIIAASLDANIKLLIVDSPYVSLTELYKTTFHLSAKGKGEIIFKNICLYFAKRRIKKKFHYDIENICPIFFIEDVTIPTIYIISRNDKVVHPAHTLYLAYKQKSEQKIIYTCEKASHAYESFSYDNKLTAAIRTVLFGAKKADVQNVFSVYTYMRVFNGLMEKYSHEFCFIDSLIQKKLNRKDKIIDKVKQFICFKYQTKASLSSSTCFNQSTIDSIRHTSTTSENDYMQYESSQNSLCWKCKSVPGEEHERDNHGLSEEQNQREDHGLVDEYEYPFHDAHDFVNGQDATENPVNASALKGYDANKVPAFSPTFQHQGEQSGQRRFKVMHMQSARSSLKSKKNTFKKSLTWDTKLQSAVTYSKEDCPLELLKN